MPIAIDDKPTRVRMEGVSWETFEALLRELGDHRWRVTYSEGVLEFMAPLREHELVKKLIARFIEQFTLEQGIDIRAGGSTTYRRQDLKQGAEPDECYYIQSAPTVRDRRVADLSVEPPPDLVVEVEVTHSTARRLAIYAAMGVPEVWRCDGDRVTVWRLAGGTYLQADASQVLPGMPLSLVNELLAQRYDQLDTALVRTFVERLRDNP